MLQELPNPNIIAFSLTPKVCEAIHLDLLMPLVIVGADDAKSLSIPHAKQDKARTDIIGFIERVMAPYQSHGTVWTLAADNGALQITQGALTVRATTASTFKGAYLWKCFLSDGLHNSKDSKLINEQVCKLKAGKMLPGFILGKIQTEIESILSIACEESVVNGAKKSDLRRERLNAPGNAFSKLDKCCNTSCFISFLSFLVCVRKSFSEKDKWISAFRNCPWDKGTLLAVEKRDQLYDKLVILSFVVFMCSYAGTSFVSLISERRKMEIRNEEVLLFNRVDKAIKKEVFELSNLLCKYIVADKVRAKCDELLRDYQAHEQVQLQ